MAGLTSLERAAIAAILAEAGEDPLAADEHLLHASVLSRENTGGGFFSELAVPIATTSGRANRHLGDNVWISVEGLERGLGMILHLEVGRLPLLEGYPVGGEDTSKIDFEQAHFVVANHPGGLPSNGS